MLDSALARSAGLRGAHVANACAVAPTLLGLFRAAVASGECGPTPRAQEAYLSRVLGIGRRAAPSYIAALHSDA